MNLSWKLDLVLRGVSGPALLDTYSSERSAHVRHAIDMSIALGKVICVLDEDAAAQRDRRMIAAAADPARVLPAAAPPLLGDGVLQYEPDGTRAAGSATCHHNSTCDTSESPDSWTNSPAPTSSS